MKILLLSRYSQLGASSRIRTYQYLPYLNAHGVDVTVVPFFGDNYLKGLYTDRNMSLRDILGSYVRRLSYIFSCYSYDLLWIEYELLPWLPAWGEDLLRGLGIPYVVDYDDAIFHNYELHSSRIVRYMLGNKIDLVMRRAALVTVGNHYLAERAWRAGAKQVEYLPTVVDLEKYYVAPHAKNEVFRIGWIGSPTTAKYLYMVLPALKEICKDNAKLILVGSGQIDFDGVSTEIRTWSEKSEVSDVQNFDVGIMPLHDEPWARGKCGYKIIQYMACGKPVVASPVGINRQIVEEGKDGFLATDTATWVRALNILRDNHGLREIMGQNGREKVEKQYCVQITAPRLLSLLKAVTKMGLE